MSQGSKVAGCEIPRALSLWLWIQARFPDVQRCSLLGCPRGALGRAVVQGQVGTKRPLLWHLDTGAQKKAQEDGVGGDAATDAARSEGHLSHLGDCCSPCQDGQD